MEGSDTIETYSELHFEGTTQAAILRDCGGHQDDIGETS